MNTISNMPLDSKIDLANGLKVNAFLPTKKMSTYLVAFIVSDFVKISNKTANGVKVFQCASML